MNYTPVANFQEAAAAPAPSAEALLDVVGVDAFTAIGFKKLRSAYTGDCIEVRRSSDSTTQDIGFDANGDVDTAAIASFVGTGNTGTIVTWYDQSGNGNDFNTSNTPNAGTSANEPYIYYSNQVTTDAGGNVAAYSIEPGSTSTTGARFLNSPTMTARYAPTVTMFGQINASNSNGIIMTDQENGYNFGTYGSGTSKLSMIQSNGSTIQVKNNVANDATDPFASTIFFHRASTAKWWITTELDNTTFESSFSIASNAYNTSDFDKVTIFRYYANSLYQNCAISGFIYWEKDTAVTLTDQELYDLYDWVETNLGYTNNATQP